MNEAITGSRQLTRAERREFVRLAHRVGKIAASDGNSSNAFLTAADIAFASPVGPRSSTRDSQPASRSKNRRRDSLTTPWSRTLRMAFDFASSSSVVRAGIQT